MISFTVCKIAAPTVVAASTAAAAASATADAATQLSTKCVASVQQTAASVPPLSVTHIHICIVFGVLLW